MNTTDKSATDNVTTNRAPADRAVTDTAVTDSEATDRAVVGGPAVGKPIGFWLKHLDKLIDAQADATLAQLNPHQQHPQLRRRRWQVLNLLHQAPCGADEIERALAPFWSDGPTLEVTLNGIDGLMARGWVSSTPDGFALTQAGRAGHATIAARVERNRAQLLSGLTPQQYTETIRVLSQMAANAEAVLAQTTR